MTIAETENEIVEEFSIFDQWDDKYQYIIDMGKSLAVMNDEYKTEDRLIKGCQSRVWLHTELIPTESGGKIIYHADSDAIITKGLVALMVRVLSDHTPKEIVDAQLTFINKIGLAEHLSPTRANGLVSMVKQMKMDAFAINAKK
ncbi:MAG: SufE family protein [Bacteroidota bacterium]|nr:SufE family protein [Bacteroidota bacterium]